MLSLVAATLLMVPAVATAGVDPVVLPDEPDGVTWIVLDESGTPASWAFTAKATGDWLVSDDGDSNQIWEPGEPLRLETLSNANVKSFFLPNGTAWKETNNEFRLPFTVSSSGHYTFDLSLTLDQLVADLHGTFLGASRPSYQVINEIRIIESDGGGESTVYGEILSFNERIEDGWGSAFSEAALAAFQAALNFIPGGNYWATILKGTGAVILATLTTWDILQSGAEPDATYEDKTFQFTTTRYLDADKQYYLSIRTEQWVWAQIFALYGEQWTVAWTGITLEHFNLTPPQPPTISSLTATPNPVERLHPLSVTAIATDPEDNVATVSFYRDTNDDATPQPDELIGTGSAGSDGWQWVGIVSAGWPLGLNRVMAVAVDADGLESNVESTMVAVEPPPPPPGCWIPRGRCDDQPVGPGANVIYGWAEVNALEELFITNVEYRLRVQHDCVEELDLWLVSGNGTFFELWPQDGVQCLDGGLDDDDENDDDIEFGSGCGGGPPNCIATNPVYRQTDFFDGEPVHGNWKLWVADRDSNGNVGITDCAFIRLHYDAPGTPDLRVEEIWTEPSQPIAGQSVSLCARIRNVDGGVDDGLAWKVRWEYLINGEVAGVDFHDVLYPGDPREECDSFTFSEPGTYTYEVCADDQYCLGETNLENNCLSMIIEVVASPEQVTDPTPAHEEQLISVNPILSWAAAEHAISYDVYLGTNPACDQFRTNMTGLTWSPATLEYDATYYWRIDAVNDTGTTMGDCWNFTTRCAPSPGDADGDCLVGLCDIDVLFDLWGPCLQPECPDFDGDGLVGIVDFLILLANWTGGTTCE